MQGYLNSLEGIRSRFRCTVLVDQYNWWLWLGNQYDQWEVDLIWLIGTCYSEFLSAKQLSGLNTYWFHCERLSLYAMRSSKRSTIRFNARLENGLPSHHYYSRTKASAWTHWFSTSLEVLNLKHVREVCKLNTKCYVIFVNFTLRNMIWNLKCRARLSTGVFQCTIILLKSFFKTR